MISSLLGKKIRQTQQFDKNGRRWPVTELEVGPCPVVHIKKTSSDGYTALQIGFGMRKEKNVSKPQRGHMKKARLSTTPRFLREIRLANDEALGAEIQPGNALTVDQIFYPGDIITVSGVSKGKGFAGAIKRWGFSGGPKTHGQSDRHRSPGSIGAGTTPGRVLKGKKMAGRMGGDRVTVKNLRVLTVDSENNKLIVTGLVPGPSGTLITVTRTIAADRTEEKGATEVPAIPVEEKKAEQTADAVTKQDKTTEKEPEQKAEADKVKETMAQESEKKSEELEKKEEKS